jgi:hypothetical protein
MRNHCTWGKMSLRHTQDNRNLDRLPFECGCNPASRSVYCQECYSWPRRRHLFPICHSLNWQALVHQSIMYKRPHPENRPIGQGFPIRTTILVLADRSHPLSCFFYCCSCDWCVCATVPDDADVDGSQSKTVDLEHERLRPVWGCGSFVVGRSCLRYTISSRQVL